MNEYDKTALQVEYSKLSFLQEKELILKNEYEKSEIQVKIWYNCIYNNY